MVAFSGPDGVWSTPNLLHLVSQCVWDQMEWFGGQPRGSRWPKKKFPKNIIFHDHLEWMSALKCAPTSIWFGPPKTGSGGQKVLGISKNRGKNFSRTFFGIACYIGPQWKKCPNLLASTVPKQKKRGPTRKFHSTFFLFFLLRWDIHSKGLRQI